jgi:hypothetical protein
MRWASFCICDGCGKWGNQICKWLFAGRLDGYRFLWNSPLARWLEGSTTLWEISAEGGMRSGHLGIVVCQVEVIFLLEYGLLPWLMTIFDAWFIFSVADARTNTNMRMSSNFLTCLQCNYIHGISIAVCFLGCWRGVISYQFRSRGTSIEAQWWGAELSYLILF